MARKPALSEETLLPLGAERLARIILEEAEGNPSFRKRVTAALAAIKGPDAVAKLIDRRLAALEGARAMIGWDKELALSDDLRATVATTVKDLGALSPVHAVERLLRFIDTYDSVMQRIGESAGRVQDVYDDAADAVPDLVARLDQADRALLPARLMASMKRHAYGPASHIAIAVVPLLPPAVLATWDRELAGAGAAGKGGHRDHAERLIPIRQAIADARGDVDKFAELQAQLPNHRQNPHAVAERLLAAGRLDEALTWVRKETDDALDADTRFDLELAGFGLAPDVHRVVLEARTARGRACHESTARNAPARADNRPASAALVQLWAAGRYRHALAGVNHMATKRCGRSRGQMARMSSS